MREKRSNHQCQWMQFSRVVKNELNMLNGSSKVKYGSQDQESEVKSKAPYT